MAFSPDGASLAYGGVSPGNSINLFIRILDTGFTKGFTIRPLKTDILSLAWSPDGKLLATGGRERVLRIWDVESERCTFEVYDGPVQSALLTMGNGWQRANDEVAPIDKTSSWDISLCNKPPQGQAQRQVEVVDPWDDPTCRSQIPLAFTGQEADISSIAFSPDGLILASGDARGETKLWDVLYREQLTQQPARATGIVSAVDFSQVEDNLLLAVSSLDRTISLNNLRTTDSLMAFNKTVESAINGVAFTSADSLRAIGSDGAQTVLLAGSVSGEASQATTFTPQSASCAEPGWQSFAALVETIRRVAEVWSVRGSSLLSIPAPGDSPTTQENCVAPPSLRR
jgi:WD40 repeat protein